MHLTGFSKFRANLFAVHYFSLSVLQTHSKHCPYKSTTFFSSIFCGYFIGSFYPKPHVLSSCSCHFAIPISLNHISHYTNIIVVMTGIRGDCSTLKCASPYHPPPPLLPTISSIKTNIILVSR